MNIKIDGSIPSIKNQYGLTVPCYIISFFGHRDNIITILKNKGLNNICKEHLQDVYNLLFEIYKEHPINNCKTYNDLCKVHLENKYNSFKKLIEKRKGTILFDFPDIFRMQGFITCNFKENDEDNFVTIYETDMSFEDGYISVELEKTSIQKMLESLK